MLLLWYPPLHYRVVHCEWFDNVIGSGEHNGAKGLIVHSTVFLELNSERRREKEEERVRRERGREK